jgi:hypothetical protein
MTPAQRERLRRFKVAVDLFTFCGAWLMAGADVLTGVLALAGAPVGGWPVGCLLFANAIFAGICLTRHPQGEGSGER